MHVRCTHVRCDPFPGMAVEGIPGVIEISFEPFEPPGDPGPGITSRCRATAEFEATAGRSLSIENGYQASCQRVCICRGISSHDPCISWVNFINLTVVKTLNVFAAAVPVGRLPGQRRLQLCRSGSSQSSEPRHALGLRSATRKLELPLTTLLLGQAKLLHACAHVRARA
jgi:hypothetical protein